MDAGDVPTFSITGGADELLFAINSASGAVSFLAAPDFETPGSAAGSNVYTIEVTASDGNGGTDVQTLTVTVDGVNEDPVITSTNTASVDENTTAVTIRSRQAMWMRATCRLSPLRVVPTSCCSPLIVPVARFHSSRLQTLKRPVVRRAPTLMMCKSPLQTAMAASDVQTLTVTVDGVNEDPTVITEHEHGQP